MLPRISKLDKSKIPGQHLMYMCCCKTNASHLFPWKMQQIQRGKITLFFRASSQVLFYSSSSQHSFSMWSLPFVAHFH